MNGVVSDEENRVDRLLADNSKKRLLRYLIYLLIFMIVAWSVQRLIIHDTDWSRLGNGTVGKTVAQFLTPDFSILGELIWPAWETLLMATLATLLGLVLAVPVAWLGAKNVTPIGRLSYGIGRILMTLSRSVHEIVWALIFVAAVGLGAMAGILAMAVRSIGFVSKTVSEAIEEIDYKPVEALMAAGANRFQILLFAVIPQVIPVFIGNAIFEWDINIRRSTIMGLVGAGGLGFSLFRQMAQFNYGGITTVILVVLVLIILGEVVSRYVRRAVI